MVAIVLQPSHKKTFGLQFNQTVGDKICHFLLLPIIL